MSGRGDCPQGPGWSPQPLTAVGSSYFGSAGPESQYGYPTICSATPGCSTYNGSGSYLGSGITGGSAGIFSLRATKVRIGDVTDGTSNTFLTGEERMGTPENQWWGAPPRTPGYDRFGQWTDTGAVTTTLRGINHLDIATLGYYGQGFGSVHIGGAQFGMADGSVRFVSENVSIIVFNAAGSKDKNELVGEF